MKSGIDKILQRSQAEYLDTLLPPRDALLAQMERFAAERNQPIADPEVAQAMRYEKAVTLGDVRGIGPEIIEKAAASREVRDAADLVFVGPADAGIPVHEQTGTWRAGAPAADAGRFAGTSTA